MHYKALVLFKVSPEVFEEIENKLDDKKFKHSMIDQLATKLKNPFREFDMNTAKKEENVKFAAWIAEDVIATKYLLDNLDRLEEIYPEAIVTPELRWLELTNSSNKATNHWEKLVMQVLEKNKENGVALVIDWDI